MAEKICFVISPIGDEGTDARRNADHLFDLIISPAVEKYGYSPLIGHRQNDPGEIQTDVVSYIKNAPLCVCDMSIIENMPLHSCANVYYELGRRLENEKPIILLKSKHSQDLPIDVSGMRTVEYDLDDRDAMIAAKKRIQEMIMAWEQKSLELIEERNADDLVSAALQRIERKVDRLSSGGIGSIKGSQRIDPVIETDDDDPNIDPADLFKYALIKRNIPLAERAMFLLKGRMDELSWLDLIAEQVAAMGSVTAGEIIIENAERFFDSNMSFKKKTEYLGCLVSFAAKSDREEEILELVESSCERLKAFAEGEDPEDVAQLHNQPNRLYYGIYANTDNVEWLKKAIAELNKAYAISPSKSVCYNLATCYNRLPDYEQATRYIDECLAKDAESGREDVDHVELACKIYYKNEDPRFEDMMTRLERISQIKATNLRRDLRRG